MKTCINCKEKNETVLYRTWWGSIVLYCSKCWRDHINSQ